MIEKLIYDARELQKEAIDGEQSAQRAYKGLVSDTNAALAEKEQAVVNMTEDKATAEGEKVTKDEALSAVKVELGELAEMNGQLHKECDFVLKNFETRQTARQQEIEAIQQA